MSIGRKPRADGQRNRERLMAAAKAGFAEIGPEVSLEEIARRAEVGIGTLYRHFPNRDALVAAVYQREVQQLGEAATNLLASTSPGEALRQWMRLFIDYVATKKVIASALGAMAARAPHLYAPAMDQIMEALSLLVDRATASGDIRGDVTPDDLLRALIGFAYGNSNPGWQVSALRLIDILSDGLRPSRT